MKPFVAALAALIGLAITGTVQAQKDKPFDFTLPESPRKPAPEWFKAIDQGDKDPRFKGYTTAEGIKLEVVAEQPVVVNPVGMTFADDGGLYVLEWAPGEIKPVEETITYKDGSKRNFTAWKKSTKDVVKRLRDTNGDGVYDEAQVVLETEFPSSILIHDGWLYLTGRGSVRRYRQSQKDGPYDVQETIAQGFSGLGHEQVSGLTLGHDGWLYITAGDHDSYAEGSDGSRATVLRTGAVFRCRPDGSKLHTYAIGFRNPYRDVAFDIGYQMFLADNDSPDGGKFAGCRLIQAAEGGDFGWRRLPTGQADPFRAAVWGELPGKLTPMLKTGKGAPAGLLIYEEIRFPEHFRGVIYYPDVVQQSIRGYQLRPMGSTFEVAREFELMKSSDPLFRPCQMVSGPDGAMYVCDWRSDSDGTKPGNGKTGRIWKLTWAGAGDQPALVPLPLDRFAKLADKTNAELQEMLAADARGDRLRAQRELTRRGGDEVRKLLLKDLVDGEQNVLRRVAALGALNSMWNKDVQLACISMLQDGPPDIRRLSAEALALNGKPGDGDIHSALLRALADQNLATRRAVALAMGKIGHPDAADSLVANLRSDRDIDPYLTDGYLRAIERLGKPGIDKLIELSLSGDPKDFDRVVDIFLALRSKEAADAIPELLKYPHLTVPQRTRLLETYRHFLTDPAVSLSVVAEFLTVRPDEPLVVKLAGLQTLAQGGQLKGERIENLAINLLDEQDPETRRTVIQIIEAGRVKRAAPKLAGLLTDPADATAILKALRVLEDKSVVPIVKEFAKEKASLEALRTLAALDAKSAQETTLVLGANPGIAKQMGDALLAKKLPSELTPQVIEALKPHAEKDAALAKLLADLMKLNPPK